MKSPLHGWTAGLLMLLCLTSGCTLWKNDRATPERTPENVLQQERQYGESMLAAFRDNRADVFLSLLPPDSREKFGRNEFVTSRRNITEALGDIVSFEYLTSLEMNTFRPHLWKVRMRKKVGDEFVTQEVLYRVVISKLDGGDYVLNFGFQ